MWNIVKKYFSLIDDVISDFFGDLKSFRVQLVYMSYIFNAIVLWAVVMKGLDWKALTVSFGTQTAIYMFYFASKKQENDIKAQQEPEEDEPKVERDPEV